MTRTQELRARLLERSPSDRLWGWLAPGFVALVGGFMRLFNLGHPHALVFDETYYVKEGWSMVKYGVEMQTDPSLKDASAEFARGNTDIFSSTMGEYVVHPPVGKWIIGAGEWLVGVDHSASWRVSAAIFGAVSILMVGRIARRMFGSTALGTIAAFLMAFEGLHFVMSRTGILDIFVMFFALAGFGALLLDRDASRRLFASKEAKAEVEREPAREPVLVGAGAGAPGDSDQAGGSGEGDDMPPPDPSGRVDTEAVPLGALTMALAKSRAASAATTAERAGSWPTSTFGPWLGGRPWRWAAGLMFGLCAGTKWSGFVFLAAFALMSVLWDMGARRTMGVKRWFTGSLMLDAPYAFVATVGAAFVTYVASWTGWMRSAHGYNRTWAIDNPGEGPQFLPPTLRSLWHYHQEAWGFNTTLDSTHPYASTPWGWLIQVRPTSFYYNTVHDGQSGCTVADCSQAINPIGTITTWWLGIIALLVCVWWWGRHRDWRAGAALAGVAAGWVPWLIFSERTIFTFYSVAFEPYLILAIAFAVGIFIDGVKGDETLVRRRWLVVGGWLLMTLAIFAFFYPVYTADTIPYDQWHLRMWFPSWV